MNQKEVLVPVADVPRLLGGVKITTIRRWIAKGLVPVVRLGRRVFVKESVIDRIIEGGLGAVSKEAE